MKVESENEVAQSCLILRDPLDCSLPGSSIHGIFQARALEWGAIAFSGLGSSIMEFLSTYPHTYVLSIIYLLSIYLSIYLPAWIKHSNNRMWSEKNEIMLICLTLNSFP